MSVVITKAYNVMVNSDELTGSTGYLTLQTRFVYTYVVITGFDCIFRHKTTIYLSAGNVSATDREHMKHATTRKPVITAETSDKRDLKRGCKVKGAN
jgi:hypothetical protein